MQCCFQLVWYGLYNYLLTFVTLRMQTSITLRNTICLHNLSSLKQYKRSHCFIPSTASTNKAKAESYTKRKTEAGVTESEGSSCSSVLLTYGLRLLLVSSREINLREINSYVVNAFCINLSRDQL